MCILRVKEDRELAPEDALVFVRTFQKQLPPGWGFLSFEDDDGVPNLILSETIPPMPAGWMLWIAKPIGSGILKGGVYFTEKDRPEDVEARAWIILGLLELRLRSEAATWN